jgi:hypothetical protein
MCPKCKSKLIGNGYDGPKRNKITIILKCSNDECDYIEITEE